jgi:hypothetical protein
MKNIKKEITFIYKDAVQKQVYEMIAEEAVKRGYKVRFSDNPFEKCEIGWYCEHVNFPQNSRFSIIMLHDIMQQYINWPDIWMREPWNKYDIGFLPSKVWRDNWEKCSKWYYANPRKGVYLVGWPKADRVKKYADERDRTALEKKYRIDSQKRTVLYAPAWENDGKQDEFVQAMMQLDVNILIKQAPWTDDYPEQLANIEEMNNLHKSNERVIILDPKENILDAIVVSDILVSEESSTMSECVMMGKPAISVCDWLIPDTKPSRLPENNYDYIIRTTKMELSSCVKEVLDNYNKYKGEAERYSEKTFSNIGGCISKMLDILDKCLNEQCEEAEPLKPMKRVSLSPDVFIKHVAILGKRNLVENYSKHSFILNKIYLLYKKNRMK